MGLAQMGQLRFYEINQKRGKNTKLPVPIFRIKLPFSQKTSDLKMGIGTVSGYGSRSGSDLKTGKRLRSGSRSVIGSSSCQKKRCNWVQITEIYPDIEMDPEMKINPVLKIGLVFKTVPDPNFIRIRIPNCSKKQFRNHAFKIALQFYVCQHINLSIC